MAKGTMGDMRVDNPEHGHDRNFGFGAHEPERHDAPVDHPAAEHHGLFDHLGESTAAAAGALGGHVEIGHLDHDFGHDGHHEGLDGLHDSVHTAFGLGFGGDEHHSVHESIHDGLHHHEVAHDQHGLLHDVAHDLHHDVDHDAHHHDLGLGFGH